MSDSVLVIGAGPAGLTAAVVLAENGVDVRIADRDTGPVTQSRAAVVHVRTLELLDRLGIAARAVAQGVPTTRVEAYERGRLVGEISLAGDGVEKLTRFPFALGLSQDRTERLLIERLAELGVLVEWETELVTLAAGPDHVTAVLRRSGDDEQARAGWIIGADGATSAVRQRSASRSRVGPTTRSGCSRTCVWTETRCPTAPCTCTSRVAGSSGCSG